MTYKVAAIAVGLAVLGLRSEARADDAIGLRVSVERLFGFAFSSLSLSSTTGTVTNESTSNWISLNVLGSSAHAFAPTLLAVPVGQPPRVGVDYEIAGRITVGAAGFFSWNTLNFADSSSTTLVGFGVAPRVGYLLRFNDRWSLWARAGATFASMSATASPPTSGSGGSQRELTYTSLTLNVEPTITFMPTAHFGLSAALIADVPLTGTLTTTTGSSSRESDATQLLLGLQLGVMGRF